VPGAACSGWQSLLNAAPPLRPTLLQVVSKPGATIDDSEMIEGLVLDHKAGEQSFPV